MIACATIVVPFCFGINPLHNNPWPTMLKGWCDSIATKAERKYTGARLWKNDTGRASLIEVDTFSGFHVGSPYHRHTILTADSCIIKQCSHGYTYDSTYTGLSMNSSRHHTRQNLHQLIKERHYIRRDGLAVLRKHLVSACPVLCLFGLACQAKCANYLERFI